MKQTKPARGNIIELTVLEGREVAKLAGYDASEVRDGILTIEFVKGQSRPAVRAAEVATLLSDPVIASALSGCSNMDERKAVLIPLAQKGYKVDSPLTDPITPPAPTPDPAPSAPPQGFDPSDFVTVDTLDRVETHLASVIDRVVEQVSTLAPTVIQVGAAEPVTLPAGELVHESTADVIEDMEDGLHVYLTGAPGVGKSRMAATIAKAFGFEKERTHFFSVSNMDQKNSLLGFVSPVTGEFIPGPLYHAYHGHFPFLDELDAGNGAAMNALNAALDSPFLTFPNGETLARPDRLFILGAGNTVGKGGDMMFLRNQMDSATRNRWVFHHIDYDRGIERAIVTGILGDDAERWLTYCWGIRQALEGERVVFSTRNITAGAKMLRRGRNIDTIIERALLPGESRDIVAKSGALSF